MWQVGPLAVYTLGGSLALGFLTATVVAIPHLRRLGIRRLQVLRLMLALMFFSVLGARLAAIVLGRYGLSGGGIFSVAPDGLAYYGGIVTSLVVLVIFCAQQRWPLLVVTDSLTPAAALGMTVALAVPLGTNLLHVKEGGPPWLNLFLFTVAFGYTYVLWNRSERTRFPGELTLLFLGIDSLLRLLFGAYWAFGEGEAEGIRGQLIMLTIVALLWFSFRGAAQRRSRSTVAATLDWDEARTEPDRASRNNGFAEGRERGNHGADTTVGERSQARKNRIPWLVGYVVLAVLILVRLYVV